MRKRLFISAVSLLLTVVCYAQWSVQDSLKLQKLLESSEELKLNPKAVRQIDFGSAVGTPRMSEDSSLHAEKFLREMEVNILLNKRVIDYRDHKVILEDEIGRAHV